MRVIAGSARHLILKTLPGLDTRPTTDKIKETLFNMIHFDLPGTLFIDIFSGSGAIGIEALSRGSKKAIFIDNNPKATAIIKENLEKTKLTEQAEVITADASSAIRRISLTTDEAAGFIFMDPPYDHGLEDNVLMTLADSNLVDEDTVIIIEMSLRADIDDVRKYGYDIIKIKEYKTNKHVFLKRSAS